MNKDFISILLQKLRTGNARLPHLNALAGSYLGRIDLSSMSLAKDGLPEELVINLLSKKPFVMNVDMRIGQDRELSENEQRQHLLLLRKLKSVQYSNDETLQEEGYKPLALGYPLLIKRSSQDPTKFIKAPLLLWSVDLGRNRKLHNVWTISAEAEKRVRFNDVLVSFIKADQDVDLSDYVEEIEEKGISSLDRLFEICAEIIDRISHKTVDYSTFGVTPPVGLHPTPERVEATLHDPWVSWSGTLSSFKLQKESIHHELEQVLENIDQFKFDEADTSCLTGASMAGLSTDPTQQGLIHSLRESTKELLSGPPGTGKSHGLTAVITNALANGARVLVVCEKKTALNVIRRNLKDLSPELGELCVLVDDLDEDRRRVVDSVRNRMRRWSGEPDHAEYRRITTSYEQQAARVNELHAALSTPIFSTKSWSDLVGEYSASDRIVSWTTLREHLSKERFLFEEDEYNKLVLLAEKGQPLFKSQNHVPPILHKLHPRFFKSNNPVSLRDEIETTIKTQLDNITRVQEAHTSFIKKYHVELTSHYQTYYGQLVDASNEVLSKCEDMVGRFGENSRFDHFPTRLKLAAKGLFVRRCRGYREHESLVRIAYGKTVEGGSAEHPSWKPIVFSSAVTLSGFLDHSRSLSHEISEWSQGYPDRINSLIKQSYDGVLHPKLIHLRSELDQVRTLTQQIVKGEAEAALFEKSELGVHDNLADTLAKVSVHEAMLRELFSALDGFSSYHSWRFLYDARTAQEQHTLDALSVTDESWPIAFKSWYLHWVLASFEAEFNIDPSFELEKLSELERKGIDLTLRKIIADWRHKQAVEMSRRRVENVTSLYNYRGAPGQRRNSLRTIVGQDTKLFTTFFPVLLCSPSVCTSILPLEEGLYDLVIFDEASQLRLEDTFTCLMRGKQKLVSGDKQQMPPSSYFAIAAVALDDEEDYESEEEAGGRLINQNLAYSESLLEFAENSNFRKSYLDVHYRSRHPYLIDFSNSAFYGGRLLPMPAARDYTPITLHEVGGLYEDGTNRSEALKVLEILTELGSRDQVPSVGVATLNMQQRDLILDLIEEERDESRVQAFTRLREHEEKLFVKNLETIQGDERDVVIISTTHGVRRDGRFIQSYGPLNLDKGYRLLNVLITRAKHEVYVCTSIPQEFRTTWEREIGGRGNTGKGIVYAYLEYARAVAKHDQKLRSYILDVLAARCSERHFAPYDTGATESPFEEEVVQSLLRHIPKHRVLIQHSFGGFRIDIVLKSIRTGRPLIAIEADGAKYHSSREAHVWDVFRQRQLESFGFKFYRIWSANWWKDREGEIKKLLAFIRRLDEEV